MAQIVEEYGFEYSGQMPGYMAWRQKWVGSKLYSRAPVDAVTAREIVAILREACPSCQYLHSGYDDSVLTRGFYGDVEVYEFFPEEALGIGIESVGLAPNHGGHPSRKSASRG